MSHVPVWMWVVAAIPWAAVLAGATYVNWRVMRRR